MIVSDLKRCNNIQDLRRLARRRLPNAIFQYLDGGADDEVTLRRNSQAFEKYALIPNALVDVSTINTTTTLLGRQIEWPVFLSPAAPGRLFHHAGELAVARAAARCGTFYALSTMSTTSLEDVAAETGGPKIFQIYVFKDRGITAALVERCKKAAYGALCLTVDTPLGGNRERDRVTGLTIPPKFTWKSWISFACHPVWSWNAALKMKFTIANFDDSGVGGELGLSAVQRVNNLFDRSVTWEDAAWLAKRWNGPLIVKGLMSVEDARKAADIGATAIMVSNHGGRQLDHTPAPIDRIAPIRDGLGDRLEIILDGGVRRGTHVITALARGANACSIGRPYLFGLASAGEAGVDHALNILRTELLRALALLGCPDISSIRRSHTVAYETMD